MIYAMKMRGELSPTQKLPAEAVSEQLAITHQLE